MSIARLYLNLVGVIPFLAPGVVSAQNIGVVKLGFAECFILHVVLGIFQIAVDGQHSATSRQAWGKPLIVGVALNLRIDELKPQSVVGFGIGGRVCHTVFDLGVDFQRLDLKGKPVDLHTDAFVEDRGFADVCAYGAVICRLVTYSSSQRQRLLENFTLFILSDTGWGERLFIRREGEAQRAWTLCQIILKFVLYEDRQRAIVPQNEVMACGKPCAAV